ncbi:cadherin-like beta sandwich domain-containing protein [Leadbettera azotonutricia]|uniref:Fibronectin type III domain protein n=1 Tax=Leadbettera azotonutricia (strain ATCC BAA-888 / DSM 13862 / ZAS-9) TaxID=545695 RepID=F5Y741_LEAAZ|nr:cadherin-like beta sandwich domain-containing protein [Leadbettera azotonutricia]AEF80377.1 fibronectin type III domain protein [Leadbettera azotonutricia ZAS-9]
MKFLKSPGLVAPVFIYGFLLIAFATAFLASCNNMAITDFVEQNTNVARAVMWDIRDSSKTMPDGAGSKRTAFKRTWNEKEQEDTLVFYIDPTLVGDNKIPIPNLLKPADIELDVALLNPQGYDLVIVPEFTVDNPLNTINGQRSVTAEQTGKQTALVKINHALIGERYRIKLHITMADGSRVFETFTSLPPIVFNTVLSSPLNLEIYAFNNNSGSIWYPYAQWEISQLSNAHPGISKLTLVFQEQQDNADWITAEYTYERDEASGNTKWVLTKIEGGTAGDMVSTLIDNSQPLESFLRLRGAFPMPIANAYLPDLAPPASGGWREETGKLLSKGKDINGKEISSAFSTYNFIVTLVDEYGLSAQASFDDGPLANETTILESLRLFDYTNNTDVELSAFKYTKGFVNYSLEVPYDVRTIRLSYEKNIDYPEQVVFYKSAIPGPPFDLDYGVTTNIVFEVSFGTDAPSIYNIAVSRLSPSRDSYLDSLYLIDEPLGPRYDTMPSFKFDDSDTTYMIYVPSTVEYINLKALLPNIPEGEEGYTAANPKVPSRLSVQFLKNDLVNFPEGEKKTDGDWEHIPIGYNENIFHINVRPEMGLVNTYNLMVVRAPSSNDTSADLTNLTVSGIILSPTFGAEPKRESYTADVPYGTNSVTVAAAVQTETPGAAVVNVNVKKIGIPDSLPITVSGALKNIYSAVLNLTAGESYPVTITVANGLARKDYHVLVNAMPSTPVISSAAPGVGQVRLNWTESTAASNYEVYYSSTANFAQAARVGGDLPASARAYTVTGLANHQTWYFWVRSKKGSILGAPSTVVNAMPRSDNKVLTNITVADADGNGYPLDKTFASGIVDYSLIVPWSAGAITITGAKGESNQALEFSGGTGGVQTGSRYNFTLEPGATAPVTVTVKADYVNIPGADAASYTTTYRVTVTRRPGTPAGFSALPEDGEAFLQWNSAPGASSYAVYYRKGVAGNPVQLILTGTEPHDETSPHIETVSEAAGEVTCTVKGLTNATTSDSSAYYFWVQAVKEDLAGAMSEAVSAVPRSKSVMLAGITPDGESLSPAFEAALQAYTVTILDPLKPSVDLNVAQLPGQESRQLISAVISGGTLSILSSNKYTVSLNPGSSAAVIFTVRSNEGSDVMEYKVTVNRKPATVTEFSAVKGNRRAVLTWNVSAGASGYDVFSGTADTAGSVLPVTGTGPRIESLTTSGSAVTCIVSGLTNTATYYFRVRAKAETFAGTIRGNMGLSSGEIKPLSNVYELTNLVPSAGSLSPAFNPDTLDYTVVVPSGTASVTIAAFRDAAEAASVTPSASQTITLVSGDAPGNNSSGKVSFMVTAQDGSNNRTYTVSVQTAGIGINFTMPPDWKGGEDITLVGSSLSWASDTPLTVSAADLLTGISGYTCQWFKDNVEISGANDPTLTISARKFSQTQHVLTLRIVISGTVYSKSVSFTVGP